MKWHTWQFDEVDLFDVIKTLKQRNCIIQIMRYQTPYLNPTGVHYIYLAYVQP